MKLLEIITGVYIAKGIRTEWRFGSKLAAFAITFVYFVSIVQVPFILYNIIKG